MLILFELLAFYSLFILNDISGFDIYNLVLQKFLKRVPRECKCANCHKLLRTIKEQRDHQCGCGRCPSCPETLDPREYQHIGQHVPNLIVGMTAEDDTSQVSCGDDCGTFSPMAQSVNGGRDAVCHSSHQQFLQV